MENLLTSYLYSHKNCPLPTVGSLLIQSSSAAGEYSEKKILAPVPAIQFVSREINADELLQYISIKQNIDIQQASVQLGSYCDRLLQMQPYEEIKLGSAGNFFIDTEGALHFKSSVVPAVFLPSVPAERVIHPDASHDMLVGDTQTNTTSMAELLNQGEARRPKWVWLAAGLAVAGLLAIVMYMMNRQAGNTFGNSSGIQAPAAPTTYQSSGK